MEPGFYSRHVPVGERDFLFQLTRFANGAFLIISEGTEPRIGSLVLGLKTGPRASTSILIPGKFEGISASMLAELVASRTKGIALASLFLKGEADSGVIKQILSAANEFLGAGST